MGELSEIFQWRGEIACGLPGFSEEERQHVGEEASREWWNQLQCIAPADCYPNNQDFLVFISPQLADVLLYLTRLADACGIALGAAAMDKVGVAQAPLACGRRPAHISIRI